MTSKAKWILSISSIGVLSYILTDIIHEVIGHGGTCIILGQEIKLLSSVYFKSKPGSFVTDLGGPFANLFFGLVIYAFLSLRKNLSVFSVLLLFTTMSYNLFWFSGTILQSSFSRTGDWTYVITKLNIGTMQKPVLVILGIIAYFFSIKCIRTQLDKINLNFNQLPLKQIIYYSYFAAAAAAVIAGLFFKYDRVHSAFEGLLEMIASLPILFIGGTEKVKNNIYEPSINIIFSIATFILLIIFCLTLGVGIS